MAVKRANGINNDASGANGTDLNSLAQQELLNADRDFNPYRYENQSSEANPRVSRMFDAPPSPNTFERRLSRLPPGLYMQDMQDPFGYGLATESSPYDSALTYSAQTVNGASRQSMYLQPGSPGPAGSSRPPSASSAWSLNEPPAWERTKRSSSFGDAQMIGRQSFMANLPGPMPSKLSVSSDPTQLQTRSMSSSPTMPNFVPTDQDYMHSKLYQRTLKAQKALERERGKQAAKGKVSPEGSLGVQGAGRLSRLSLVSDAASLSDAKSKRMSFGWLRSRSEVALAGPSSFTPPLPSSQSSSMLPLPRAERPARQSSHDSRETANSLKLPTFDGQNGAPVILPRPHHRAALQHRQSENGTASLRSQSSHSVRPELPNAGHLAPVQDPATWSQGASGPPSLHSKASREHLTPAAVPLPSSQPPSAPASPGPNGRSDAPESVTRSSAWANDRGDSSVRSPSPLRPAESAQAPAPPAAAVAKPEVAAYRNGSTESEREPALATSSIDSMDTSGSRTSPLTPSSSALGHQNGPSLPPGAAPAATVPYDDVPQRKRKSSLSLLFGNFGKHADTAPSVAQLPPSPRLPDVLPEPIRANQIVSSPPSSASTVGNATAKLPQKAAQPRPTVQQNGPVALEAPAPIRKSSWSFGRRRSQSKGVQRNGSSPETLRMSKSNRALDTPLPPLPQVQREQRVDLSPKPKPVATEKKSSFFSFGRSSKPAKLTKDSKSLPQAPMPAASYRRTPSGAAAPIPSLPVPAGLAMPNPQASYRRPPREAPPPMLAGRH